MTQPGPWGPPPPDQPQYYGAPQYVPGFPPPKKSRTGWVMFAVIAVIALVAAGVAAVIVLRHKNVPVGGAAETSSADSGPTPLRSIRLAAPNVATKPGTSEPKATLTVYEDFLCPFCGQLEKATRDDLARLAADGKVRVEYRPFDLLSRLGDYPIRATNAFALVLEKSGADVAKKFHDLLYENQPSEEDPGAVTDDDLVNLAVEAGATESDVRDGIENLAKKSWVDEATAEASKAGVTGTPTILLDGKVFQDGRTVEELATNLVSELE